MASRDYLILAGVLPRAAGSLLTMARRRLISESTRQFVKDGGWKRFLTGETLHGYIYLSWLPQYVWAARELLLPHLPDWGKELLADRYHNKVLTHEEAREIIALDHDVPRQELDKSIVPFRDARTIVLDGSPAIAAMECACRAYSDEPCYPTKVCLAIGQPFVDFVVEHQRGTRRITTQEALDILEDQHARGHVHAAWFKEACHGRLYAICNCCPCCCSGIKAMQDYGITVTAPSGYCIDVEPDKCNNHGRCMDICPFKAISYVKGRYVTDLEKCMGCGVCIDRCPEQARTLKLDESKGKPLDVDLLG